MPHYWTTPELTSEEKAIIANAVSLINSVPIDLDGVYAPMVSE